MTTPTGQTVRLSFSNWLGLGSLVLTLLLSGLIAFKSLEQQVAVSSAETRIEIREILRRVERLEERDRN